MYIDATISLISGKVKKIYTLEGKRIMDIQWFVHGGEYVITGPEEVFIKSDYNRNRIYKDSNLRPRHSSIQTISSQLETENIKEIADNAVKRDSIKTNSVPSIPGSSLPKLNHKGRNSVEVAGKESSRNSLQALDKHRKIELGIAERKNQAKLSKLQPNANASLKKNVIQQLRGEREHESDDTMQTRHDIQDSLDDPAEETSDLTEGDTMESDGVKEVRGPPELQYFKEKTSDTTSKSLTSKISSNMIPRKQSKLKGSHFKSESFI
jgi:hypothetical protein